MYKSTYYREILCSFSASCNNHQSAPIKESSHVDLSSILKPNLRPEIQLKELCKAMDCLCEIDDFTKVNIVLVLCYLQIVFQIWSGSSKITVETTYNREPVVFSLFVFVKLYSL